MGDTIADLDILGIGNAIVDVLSHADDDFILGHGLPKGGMTLIDADRAAALYADTGAAVEMSGGSCANTMAAAASFGADVAYIGKVRDDVLGEIFAHDIRAAGVLFETRPTSAGPATARCLVMVSPDGQRTMSTYLGACVELGPGDIDERLVGRAKVTYLEGYLWDRPRAKDAFRAAMAAAHGAGREVALTLSDTFCVERHRDEFRALVDDDVDILFANENEIRALYQVETLEEALAQVRGRCGIVAVTRSERGSLVSSGGAFHDVPAETVETVVDTTGAGDAYAAGFLYGLTRGLDLPTCAHLGSIAAAEIISHFGSRPQVSLAELAAPALTTAG
ncbi:adenosine kinase [Actinomadura scrupuli]|uniref:adenosine kinase n=1 Tax=Actinomadura scrupuli TaxID=559629 RepID=UPI003D99CC34